MDEDTAEDLGSPNINKIKHRLKEETQNEIRVTMLASSPRKSSNSEEKDEISDQIVTLYNNI